QDAEEFVARVVSDSDQPVVMFALEWCEFCWAVRKMFAKHGIAYRSVDLDSVEYQRDDRGGKIRAALSARTSMTTIPQIFVAGEPRNTLGGAAAIAESLVFIADAIRLHIPEIATQQWRASIGT